MEENRTTKCWQNALACTANSSAGLLRWNEIDWPSRPFLLSMANFMWSTLSREGNCFELTYDSLPPDLPGAEAISSSAITKLQFVYA